MVGLCNTAMVTINHQQKVAYRLSNGSIVELGVLKFNVRILCIICQLQNC